jgi:prepilin-type N-terminal cleavage/methylation domain-containing protein
MAKHTTGRRGGFTLVEMLVVIAIIGILAAILIPVANTAIKSARRAANAFEISQLSNAIEQYKSENGGLYPPSFGEGGNNANFYANAFAGGTWRATLLGRYVMKAYPKATPTDIAYLFNNADSLDQCSALWFWLTQTSRDPRYPFTNTTKRVYATIEEQRIVPGSGGGFRPRHAGESFYIYIEAHHYPLHTSGSTSAVGDLANAQTSRPAGSGLNPTPDISVRPFIRQVNDPANPQRHDCTRLSNYLNGDTFQLHCAGLDSRYSVDNSFLRVWPCGPTGLMFDGSQLSPNIFVDDRDNQTNFSEGAAVTDAPAQQ